MSILQDKISDHSFSFKWEPPLTPNGIIVNYNIFIKFLNFTYYNPPGCVDKNNTDKDFEVSVLENEEKQYEYVLALPYASYSIQVQAKNGEELSKWSNHEVCETLAGKHMEIFLI